jgi:Na+/melibiose symporter-like transporter
MMADAVDYGEEKTGMRIDGTGYAMMGMVTKFGLAISPALALFILQASGYVARQAQTATAIKGINFCANLFPAICDLIAFCIMAFLFKLTDKEADKIRERLALAKAQQTGV